MKTLFASSVVGFPFYLQVDARRASESTWSTTSTYFTVGTEMPIPSLAITPLSVAKVSNNIDSFRKDPRYIPCSSFQGIIAARQ